jgi:membrane fusion protein, macrolide-specific efflux system
MQKRRISFWIILVLVIGLGLLAGNVNKRKTNGEQVKEVAPQRGVIQSIISTTGTVLPKNRLEIKPPVSGRVEEILVKEGDKVKTGQTIAWMSSTERAALLDAARGKGKEDLQYWQDTYKPIPLISPIDGEVIVATTQPGQAVTTSDAVVVLSDHLIARAQVDETDIGKIKNGQDATIVLDAYPQNKIQGTVEHIYYESKTVNNVTIYNVDVIPQEVPLFFRSGMNATVDFVEKSKADALILAQEAIQTEKGTPWVWIKQSGGKEPVKRTVQLGISDDKNTEITAGLNETDKVIVKSKKYELPKSDTGTNPFMPNRRR